MHYIKEFNINNVATRQVACIELHGKPNAATEGYVGVLGIDLDSPLHEVYKCIAVNGSIYSWELLSNGLSIISSSIFGGGAERIEIPYDKLRIPTLYVIKVGDTILDIEGYVYQVDALGANSCSATYSNTRLVTHGLSAYELAVEQGFKGTLEEWFESMRGYSIHVRYSAYPDGRDYSEVWRRGLNYIGIGVGVDAPTNANGYQWSVFAPGIYVGSGDMPEYADIQIDPDGTYDGSPSGGNTGGGVSSWNDLTDKPFGENEDGTVKQLDNKYLSILELEAGKDVLLPTTTGTTSVENLFGYNLLCLPALTDEETYNKFTTSTKPIKVMCDGVEYVCDLQNVGGNALIGNVTALGGSGNDEPFAAMCISNGEGTYAIIVAFINDTTPADHTVSIYQDTEEKTYKLKEEHLPFEAIKTYIDDYIAEALGGDY